VAIHDKFAAGCRYLMPYFDPAWTSNTWQVASPFFEARLEVIEGFLRGYMDADGLVHVSNTRGVRVESDIKSGLLDIQRLLARLSIESKVYQRKSSRAWALQISRKHNVATYRELIGFYPTKLKPLTPSAICISKIYGSNPSGSATIASRCDVEAARMYDRPWNGVFHI
jgi:hypothetical protein